MVPADSGEIRRRPGSPPTTPPFRGVPMYRSLIAGVGLSAAAAATVVLVAAPPAAAATTTLYVSPSGVGAACSIGQPCSLSGAQAAVRSAVAGMTGDIVVQLADGVYRLSAPL